ncbi:2Fe-2S iron-sulfur cluster-binding protein [Tissierella sp. Yu-01]|uniref:2Fe-2S iron-sulfur cluster-binding protein n=1 Tax=Tissierella sp. Yu-01 TaxID=3035694 RepID=UPI00240DCDB4|nr:2Fe-2S iron-sulfur cluster-binding protein [Tissierella sp. Yu-01]WFA08766.1 2Fe-2S iron-sulfur cluster-binding protein [Tissierella sp. Yu-01]
MLIKINGKVYNGHDGETLMEVAKRNNINIPSLCYKKGFEGLGRCRLCLVEVNEGKRKKIVSACVYPIRENLEVITKTEDIIKMRKDIILLLLLRSPKNEYIQELAKEYKIVSPERYIQKENDDCILCGLCVTACEKLGTNAISMVNRGITKKVSTPYDDPSKDCIGCGACAEVCPTNAIKLDENNGIRTIWNRDFDLVKCSVCGKYYATEDSLNFIGDKLGSKEDHVCEYCKKKSLASKFKKSFQNIY